MKISILTLFPEMFHGPFAYSIVKRAQDKGLIEIEYVNIRDFGIGTHKMVDDTEYGGGIGMVLKVDVVHAAIKHAQENVKKESSDDDLGDKKEYRERVILLSATGETFKQSTTKAFSELDHLILICGHYEGIDARIKNYIDGEISIGDFILTGGEIPAMLITDAVTRLLAGVLPEGATEDESFSTNVEHGQLLEYPHYTKPNEYDHKQVPEVLLNGNHQKIKEWRINQAKEITKKLRPDLLVAKSNKG